MDEATQEKVGSVPRDRLAERLLGGMAKLELTLDDDVEATASRLLDYLALMHRWNRAYNLTAVRDPLEMVTRHLLDSLAAMPHVSGPAVLDVGTGAGLPGMVFALARPRSWHLTLLDSAAKRMRFLQEVQIRLAPPNVTLVRSRVEDYRPEAPFDTVVCRAYAALPRIVQTSGHLVGPQGWLAALKGEAPMDELTAVPEAWQRGAEVCAIRVPGLDAQRHVVRLRRPAEGGLEGV